MTTRILPREDRRLATRAIRRARPEDLPRIVEMGLRFLADIYAGKIETPDPDRMARTAAWLLDGDDQTLFVATRDSAIIGMMGLFVFEHPFTGRRTASELFWWVEPESRGHGMRLLKAGRDWAKAAGATTLQMIAPGIAVANFYERLGYTRVETTFVTRL